MIERTIGRESLEPDALPRAGFDTALVVVGALLVVCGALALAASLVATLSTVLLTGLVLLVAGLAVAFEAISRRYVRSPWRGVVIGALYVVAGAMLVAQPLSGAAVISLILAVLFIAGGAARLVAALALRERAWGWMLVSGLVSIALGLFVLASWPLSAMWLVGTLVGIELLFAGATLIALGVAVRRVVRARDETGFPRRPMQPVH